MADEYGSANLAYPPGPINNRRLLESETIGQYNDDDERFVNQLASSNSQEFVLRRNLVEGKDFQLLKSEQWNLLLDWYGGGPTIERKILDQGHYPRVELHPLRLWVRKESDPTREFPLLVSKADLRVPNGLKTKVLRKLKAQNPSSTIPANAEIRLLINGIERNEDSDSDLEDFASVIVKDQLWPNSKSARCNPDVIVSNLWRNSSSSLSESKISHGSVNNLSFPGSDSNLLASNHSSHLNTDCSIAPGCGLMGLTNLGNTCFMNSALQCLSNTEALTRYFLEGKWELDLNVENPLGMKGLLAENYNDLLRELWCNEGGVAVNPRDLKRIIGHFAPQFSGFSQHDSQELLAFLLDGLHEDLNRIRSKPFVEIPTGNGTDDEAVSLLAWQRHKMRNDSFVLDLFTGQYRSELVCPVTGKKSVTFDPYNCITLQLPQSQEGKVRCALHRWPSGQKPTRINLMLPKTATYLDLRRRMAATTGIDPDRMVLADVFTSRFYSFHRDSSSIWQNSAAANCVCDVHVYETPVVAPIPFEPGQVRPALCERTSVFSSTCGQAHSLSVSGDGSGAGRKANLLVKVLHRRNCSLALYSYRKMEAFGTPLILAVPTDAAGRVGYSALERQICMAVARSCRTRSPALSSSTASSGKCSSSSTLEECDIRRYDFMADVDHDGGRRGRPYRGGDIARAAGHGDESDDNDWEDWRGLFALRRIDATDFGSYNQEGTQLVDNGKPLPLDALDTVGIDWTSDGLRKLIAARAEDASSDEDDIDDGAAEEVTLERLLGLFATPEELSEEDAWYSPFAGRHVRASKTMALWSVPSHLVIHLKRFAASAGGSGLAAVREKLDTLVRFPLRGLDLAPFVRGPGLATSFAATSCAASCPAGGASGSAGQGLAYDLYGVVNHYGGAGFGHYTACCLSPGDGRWHLYDDATVSPIADPATAVVTSAAYVLFYRLRQPAPARL